MGSIVKSEITIIRMCFVMDSCDLNQDTFSSSNIFHILSQFGPPSRYLPHLSSGIRGFKFHCIGLIQDPLDCEFKIALDFQKTYF